MGNVNRRALSTKEEKVDWLIAHKELWEHWEDDVWKNRPEWRRVFIWMKNVGLVSKSTYILDARLPLLIQMARTKLSELNSQKLNRHENSSHS